LNKVLKKPKNNMNKKIILVGKGASGKNFLMERFENRGFHHLVSHTTRPIRQKEKDGREYHFISEKEFSRMIENDEFFEYQKFGDYYYGTSKKEWEISNVVIMAPQGVENLKKLGVRQDCFVIYIDIPYQVRKERLCCRNGNNNEDIENRLHNDEIEFDGFKDYDLRIENPNF
jgi:guanylate kinase